METGFHGDKYLQDIADFLIEKSDFFIETGTNVGSTLAYVAKQHPNIHCISCEPHEESYIQAVHNTEKYTNVVVFNSTSNAFIEKIKQMQLEEKNVIFWLDAHGHGFEWPLKEEIMFITTYFKKAYILIDDFKVPGKEVFKWDHYKKQECSFSYIKESISKKRKTFLYYPSYEDRTSEVHPITGWGLITCGYDKINFPKTIENKITNPVEVK